MDIKQVAALFLVGGLLSTGFMVFVVRRQLGLFKLSVPPEVHSFRKALFALSSVILVGNLATILINLLTITSQSSLGREDSPSTVNVIYGIIIALTSIGSATLIWLLYRLAATTLVTTEQDTADALELSDQQYKDKK